MDVMDNFCRGCIIKFNESELLLQYSEKNRRLFVYSTGIQVKRNDTITFLLCKNCYLNMKTACNFKKQCRNSDKLFKNFHALKEHGENIDFHEFLKTHDESLKLPLMNGNSTPFNQRDKDDDNASTCTSIRNFMMDIIQDEDIPATEAKIIQEVIDEEADVLDDSLDSIWLQDDVSIDTDFKLDLNFSPFSSPKTTQKHENTCTNEQALENAIPIKPAIPSPTVKKRIIAPKKPTKSINNYPKIKAEKNNICPIEKNINIALKDVNNREYSLEELLASPPTSYKTIVQPEETYLRNTGKCIDNFDNVDNSNLDILADFFEEERKPRKPVNENEFFDACDENYLGMMSPIHTKFDADDFLCKICEKKFKGMKQLRFHFTMVHKVCIGKADRNERNRQFRICKDCGKTFNDLRNYHRHLKIHKTTKPTFTYACEVCPTLCSTMGKMKLHMRTHGLSVKSDRKSQTICPICGVGFTNKNNYYVHVRRHKKNYTCFCDECGKGFCRRTDLIVHFRSHTKEKQFICVICQKSFARKDQLTRHLKIHTGEKRFECHYCQKTYSSKYQTKQHIKKEHSESTIEPGPPDDNVIEPKTDKIEETAQESTDVNLYDLIFE